MEQKDKIMEISQRKIFPIGSYERFFVNKKSVFLEIFSQDSRKLPLIAKGSNSLDCLDVDLFLKNKKNDSKEKVAKLAYQELNGVPIKAFTTNSGSKTFFAYQDSGYFSKRLDNEYIEERARRVITKREFYSMLLEKVKMKFLNGYLLSERNDENAEFYFKEADENKLMKKLSFDKGMYNIFLSNLVEKVEISKEYYNGIFDELKKSMYETELNDEEIAALGYDIFKLLSDKKYSKKFDDLRIYRKEFDNLVKKKGKLLFNKQNVRE